MRRTQPRVVCLGNLFRDQLDRYGELEHIAERWRAAVSALAADARWSPTPTTRSSRARRRSRARPAFGIDDPRAPAAGLQHASDSKYCVRCGAPYLYDAAYVGHLGAYRCDAAATRDPSSTSPRASRARRARRRLASRSTRPTEEARVRLSVPGLYNVYNALAAASLALALGVELDEVAAGLERFRAAFGRFERFTAGDRSVLLLLIKNPAGANEAIRTLEDGGVPRRS